VAESARDDLVGGQGGDVLAEEFDPARLRRSKPEMVRSVVVLPAPLPPMSVTIAPCSILNEMPPSALIAP